jgi:hypothetical protein
MGSPYPKFINNKCEDAVVGMHSDQAIASHKLQTNLLVIQNWFKKWRIKAMGSN